MRKRVKHYTAIVATISNISMNRSDVRTLVRFIHQMRRGRRFS